MFFEKNKNVFIGAALFALTWIILFYTLIKPKWTEAAEKRETAEQRRKDWETYMKNDAARKAADKATEDKKIEYLTRGEADKKLDDNRKKIEVKFADLKRIEFGTKDSLKAFSVFAAGKGGDTSNLLNEKVKQAILRANGILKAPITPEKISNEFSEVDDSNNLLRVAMFEAFMSAARDAKVEQIVQVRHFAPAPILVPEDKITDEDSDEPKSKPKKKGSDKDKDKEEEKPKVDRLIQFPMKVLLRVPERFSNQVLFELEKPTPEKQAFDKDPRGYFCIRGFHVTVRENMPNLIEMTIQVSALLRESEMKALKIQLKDPNSGRKKVIDDDI